MEYIYAAMLLHSAGKEINEKNITTLLKAGGVEVDRARVRALVAALEGVDIEAAIKQAKVVPQVEERKAEVKEEKPVEEKKEEEKKEEETEEEALAGLGALFG